LPKKRIILSIDESDLNQLNQQAEKIGISRNLLAVQIIRKHFNRPSILKESG
jgi:hypothetical protein